MILPKGTIESTGNGGESKVKEYMDGLVNDSFTGYLLVQGELEDMEGRMEKVTGQLVLKEGEPVLCETILEKRSEKGDKGIFPLLSVIMDDRSFVEVHSKIDVGPPLAFFKECKMSKGMDVDKFLGQFKKHSDEIRRRKEEKIQQEKQKQQMITDLGEWVAQGYSIKCLDEKKDLPYKEMVAFYKDISERIGRSKEIKAFLESIKEVDLGERIDELKGVITDLDAMDRMESLVSDINQQLEQIKEKRNTIKKWINLWKEEGYNTESVESKLGGSLYDAWDSMANFMDSIQRLKELREDLDSISSNEDARGFSKQIAEIDFLLNDPNEIPGAEELLKNLRETMAREAEIKGSLMEEARTFGEQGFDISAIERAVNDRSEVMQGLMDTIRNNVARIREISSILAGMDRRDLAKKIDTMDGSMKDPFRLDDYEAQLNEVQEMMRIISAEREEYQRKVDAISDTGYEVGPVRRLFDGPLDALKAGFAGMEADIDHLQEIGKELDGLDLRWLEEEAATVRSVLKDPSQVDTARNELERIKALIDERETARERVRHDLKRWSGEGFIVARLEEVIEEDMPAFSMMHEDIKKRITQCRELEKALNAINSRFFQGEAEELRSLIKDPFATDRSSQMLSDLKEKVLMDSGKRQTMRKRIEDLKKSGYKVDSLRDVIETPADDLDSVVSDIEGRVETLSKAISDIDEWDPLESSWLHAGTDELRKHLTDLGDLAGAMEHYNDLRAKCIENAAKRKEIRERVRIWKEAGYVVGGLEKRMDTSIEDLEIAFNGMLAQVKELESLQERFDALDISHFKKEAEEIEFKLNDPALTSEIASEISHLENMIHEDKKRRSEIMKTIEGYLGSGFKAAGKLKTFMDHDMSILELEVRNFEKEVHMFKKYMESTGFNMNGSPVPDEERAGADDAGGDQQKESTDEVREEPVEEEQEPPQSTEKDDEQGSSEDPAPSETEPEPVPEEQFPEAGTVEDSTEKPGSTFSCEACGFEVPMDSESCPKCGASFETEVYQCPVCSAEVPAGSTSCPSCKAEFAV